MDFFPITLGNYQYITNIVGKNDTAKPTNLWVTLDTEKQELTIHKKDSVLETISIAPVTEKLLAKNNGFNDIMLSSEELIFEVK